MKRLAIIALLTLFAACDDELTAPKKPKTFTCADLKATSSFSWSVDAVLDTLVTAIVQITAPPCATDGAWITWSFRGVPKTYRSGGPWHPVGNGRLETAAQITKEDWARADTLYIVWGLTPDYDAENTCANTQFDSCPENYDTLAVRTLVGH